MLINIGKLLYNFSQNKKICGKTLKVKNIKQSSNIATNFLMKFKKVYQNIYKQKEGFSLDSISYLIKNSWKS